MAYALQLMQPCAGHEDLSAAEQPAGDDSDEPVPRLIGVRADRIEPQASALGTREQLAGAHTSSCEGLLRAN